jgi:hypothetical protein
MGHKY